MLVFLTFAALFLLGLIFGVWYGRKTKRFELKEYVALLIVPTLTIIWLTFDYGIVIIYIYLLSAVAGFILEWSLGWAYHHALGARLWMYERLSLSGYTSWLAIPFWGIAGIFFFLLVKAVGA
jgi:hypothetical protein